MTGVRGLVWLAVLVAAVGVIVYVSQAPKEDAGNGQSRILFIAGGADPYWQLCIAGAEAAASEFGTRLEVEMPEDESSRGLAQQMQWLSSLDEEKWDGVALGPINPDSQATSINTTAEKMPVVTVDSDVPGSRRLCHIGSSNFEAGGFAAELVREALPEGGEVVLLMASDLKTNALERRKGFEAALEGGLNEDADSPAIELSQVYLDHGDYEVCKENVKLAVEEHPDLKAIVGTFGYHGPSVLEVLSEMNKTGEIAVVAFDEDERTLAGVADGTVAGTIVQDPFMFGYESVRMLDEVASGTYLSMPVAGQVNVGVHCRIIRNENLEEFKQQLKKRMQGKANPSPKS